MKFQLKMHERYYANIIEMDSWRYVRQEKSKQDIVKFFLEKKEANRNKEDDSERLSALLLSGNAKVVILKYYNFKIKQRLSRV